MRKKIIRHLQWVFPMACSMLDHQ